MGDMRILDLFCGDGGAGEGYRMAGFDVVGADIEHHNYPAGEFIQGDALAILDDLAFLDMFNAVHTSPTCQGYTTMSAKYPKAQAEWPQLIGPVRKKLQAWGGVYVIENVVGAKRDMRNPIKLSGGMFGLGVERPRLFESNIPLTAPKHVKPATVVGVYGRHHDGRRLWTRADGSILRAARTLEEGRQAMGIDWMSWEDLTEAIPPLYTEHIGRQLIAYLEEQAA